MINKTNYCFTIKLQLLVAKNCAENWETPKWELCLSVRSERYYSFFASLPFDLLLVMVKKSILIKQKGGHN